MFTGWWGPLSSNIKIHDAHSSVKWNTVKFTSFFFFMFFYYPCIAQAKISANVWAILPFSKSLAGKITLPNSSPFFVILLHRRKRILLFCTVLIHFHYLPPKKVLCFSVSMNCLIMISIWFLSNQGQGIWF